MRVRVDHRDITWLAVDQAEIAINAKPSMRKVVAKNVNRGGKVEQGIAKAASGPHGRSYFKRISSEMTGPLQGEWGPHSGGTPVGAGWRHGVNTDSEKSADIVGPAFQKEIGDLVDGWFAGRGRTGR